MDAAPLKIWMRWKSINLQRNVPVLTDLGEMPKETVEFVQYLISDLGSRAHPWVGYLSIDENPGISTLESLRENTGLMAINITGTQVQDLSPLENLSRNHHLCDLPG